ncbi:MAG: hypothetical protein HY537_03925 [Deltaproteobacteria bacterium]|nr:hypothetical protein [Deltaproteobacteria bacterium]
MGRRKKEVPEEELIEPAAAEDSIEPEEEDLDSEPELDAKTEEAESDNETEDSAPRQPRKRRTRKSLLEQMSKDEEVESSSSEELSEEPSDEPASEELESPAPKKERAKKTSASDDTAAATHALEESMQSFVKQWANAKAASEAIASHFEKTAKSLTTLESSYVQTMQEVSRIQHRKPALMTKVALGMSVLAVIFSLISLSLGQSARQAALTNLSAKSVASAPLKGWQPASPIPSPSMPEVAFSEPDFKSRPSTVNIPKVPKPRPTVGKRVQISNK